MIQTLKVVLAVGLIYWLVITDKLNVRGMIPFLTVHGLTVGLAIAACGILILTERWRFIVKAQVESITFLFTIKLNLMGLFFNFAMPGGIGGDVIKAYYLQKDLNSSRTLAFSSALTDRAVGLYTAVMMAFLALIYEYSIIQSSSLILQRLLIWVGILFFALNAGSLILIFIRWPEKLIQFGGGSFYRFVQSCKEFIKSPQRLVLIIFLTFVSQFFTILFFYWSLRVVLNESIEWSTLCFVVPVGFMAMAIPLTPAGIGVGQAAFYFLFQNFSLINVNSGPVVITAFQMMQFIWSLIGAYLYLVRKDPKTPLPVKKVTE